MMAREAIIAVPNPGIESPLTIRSVNWSIQVLIITINRPKLIKFIGKQITIKIGRIVIARRLSKKPAKMAVRGSLITTGESR